MIRDELLRAIEALHDEAHAEDKCVFRLCQRPTCREIYAVAYGA